MILQSIPAISPLNPLTAVLPLLFVLTVSIIREGIEDYRRYRSDRTINMAKFKKYIGKDKFQEIQSKNIRVGDILLVEEGETFPSDMVLLKSSNGLNAFIQTSSLDGEKNYKKRTLTKNFEGYATPFNEKDFSYVGKAVIESPTKNLYSFNGKLVMSNEQFALKTNQLLLKGSCLRNTDWILGLVVYTGKDTKLMLNSQKSRTKQSHVEKKLNVVIFFILVIQILICLSLAIIMSIYDSMDDDNQDYYLGDNNSDEKAYLNFFSYFLLLNTMIPISLVVTIEIIKVIQCIFIVWDSEMFSEDDNAGCHVSSTTINEELGQVKYVFSDKTGTLTQNIMEFRALAIEGQTYGSIDDKIQRKASKLEVQLEREFSFRSPKLEGVLQGKDSKKGSPTVIKSKSGRTKIVLEGEKDRAIESIKLLSICHECMPEVAEIEGEKMIFYQGPSPDEATLVDFAQKQGHEFCEVTEGSCTIKYHPESGVADYDTIDVTYDVHKRMEFNSDRKRMGVFFTDALDGKHKIYIKGADSEIKLRLDKSQINDKNVEFIDDFLARSSVKGLRTLLYGVRILDDDEFEEFQSDIAKAEDDVLNSEKNLAEVYEKWEQDFILLGGTAVEDRLQEDVPQTLEDFRRAGIKVWMLTGDKMETARNIGFSCKLLSQDMVITEVKGEEKARNTFTHSFYEDNKSMMEELKKRALVIDHEALGFLTMNPDYLKYFITIAKTCDAVICSRVSPSQKAEVVRMIKKDDPANITLSIGDGANDVSMILEADIGIGIYGKEGMRAAQSADFAIHKFKYLWQLVLYHGRYNYIRIADLILYFFYKNIIFTIPQLYFAFISNYSAQTYFDDYYISFYNLFFTALPIGARSLWEKDIDYKMFSDLELRKEVKELFPALYYVGQRSLIFTQRNYFIWTGSGILQGLMIFLVHYFTFMHAIITEGGHTGGHWLISISSFTAIIIIVNLRILLTHRWINSISLLSIFCFSVILFYIYTWIADSIQFSYTYKTSQMLHETPLFYLTVFLCVGIAFSIDLFVESVKINLLGRPSAFIRKEINTKGGLSDEAKETLRVLVERNDRKMASQDIAREEYLRQKRMKKLEERQRKIDRMNGRMRENGTRNIKVVNNDSINRKANSSNQSREVNSIMPKSSFANNQNSED